MGGGQITLKGHYIAIGFQVDYEGSHWGFLGRGETLRHLECWVENRVQGIRVKGGRREGVFHTSGEMISGQTT